MRVGRSMLVAFPPRSSSREVAAIFMRHPAPQADPVRLRGFCFLQYIHTCPQDLRTAISANQFSQWAISKFQAVHRPVPRVANGPSPFVMYKFRLYADMVPVEIVRAWLTGQMMRRLQLTRPNGLACGLCVGTDTVYRAGRAASRPARGPPVWHRMVLINVQSSTMPLPLRVSVGACPKHFLSNDCSVPSHMQGSGGAANFTLTGEARGRFPAIARGSLFGTSVRLSRLLPDCLCSHTMRQWFILNSSQDCFPPGAYLLPS